MKRCFIFLFLIILSCSSCILQKSKIVEIKSFQLVGQFPEHGTDIEIWNHKVYLTPYMGYDKLKLYAHNINGSGIYTIQQFNKVFESGYRLWISSDGKVLNLNTEQPPEHWARQVSSGWGLQKHFHNKGWGVLGDTLSNGVQVRGSSYIHYHTIIESNEHGWHNLGTTLKGKNGGSRIVWCMEFFNGHYYAGTSPTDAYKADYCGNIYKLVGGHWQAIRGFDTGIACGGVISCLQADNRLFFGTIQPQTILTLDRDGDWSEFFIGANFEIAKLWKDNAEHIFAGAYHNNRIEIYQWNLKAKEFELIYKRNTSGQNRQWGTMGVCYNNNTMYVKFRDGSISRLARITYEEK